MIAKASFELADSLRLCRQFEQAITAYTEAISADPSQQKMVRSHRAECYSELAEKNVRSGNYDLAMSYFSAACTDDDSLSAYCESKLAECRHYKAQELHDAGLAAFNSGDFKGAISSFGWAEWHDSTFGPIVADRIAECWYSLGERDVLQGNYADARANYLHAAQKNASGAERVDHRFRQLRRSPGVTAALSLLPGGGQLVNKQPGKAMLHFAAFAVLAGFSLIELSVADHQYEKYEKAMDTKSAKELYRKTESAWTACLVGSGAAIVVVNLSVLDAYRSAKKFNKYFELP
jgi:tetratricopeptide (TPR) repeat protein